MILQTDKFLDFLKKRELVKAFTCRWCPSRTRTQRFESDIQAKKARPVKPMDLYAIVVEPLTCANQI